MSERAAANDSFVPFDPFPSPSAKTPGTSGPLKVVPKTEASALFSPLVTSTSAHSHLAAHTANRPVVTVQREGDLVTGIRIECGCGQVIELDCSYWPTGPKAVD